jgi:hypothetical protein
MTGWIVAGAIAWLVITIFVIAILTAAKRGEIAAQAERARARAASPGAVAARRSSASRRPWPAELDRVAQHVRHELSVDQVMIVARDERAWQRAVAVAVAGMPTSVLDRSLGAHESLAAAVALTGHAVIAPDHGSLAAPGVGAPGDAAAVPLGSPPGAIAIARLGRGQRLTADDLRRLRAVVRREGLVGRDTTVPQPTGADSKHPPVAEGERFGRRDQASAADRDIPDGEVVERRRPLGRSSWSRGN